MTTAGSAAPDMPEVAAALEHETSLASAAIAMVATGGADRVTIVGLRFGPRLLPRLQAEARERGVLARATWHDGRCDIAVQPIA